METEMEADLESLVDGAAVRCGACNDSGSPCLLDEKRGGQMARGDDWKRCGDAMVADDTSRGGETGGGRGGLRFGKYADLDMEPKFKGPSNSSMRAAAAAAAANG
ncbi:hypothetical protein CKAH01_07955 [Colletotrichum kahawae]|uniref:Uncharacterized protein n=1 Tax=Colletotrichum kahawae TaxID=34407 RepID=A0AAD9Y2B7_COLKA|nr:hypothetical protein CKAH01_07955 [Colletotrichum kahawae]